MLQPFASDERANPGTTPLNKVPCFIFRSSSAAALTPALFPDWRWVLTTSPGQTVSQAKLAQMAPLANGVSLVCSWFIRTDGTHPAAHACFADLIFSQSSADNSYWQGLETSGPARKGSQRPRLSLEISVHALEEKDFGLELSCLRSNLARETL